MHYMDPMSSVPKKADKLNLSLSILDMFSAEKFKSDILTSYFQALASLILM